MANSSLKPGHTLVVLGPSGAGKSTLLRTALEHEGAGVALLAPGDDEWDSYESLADDESYHIEGFDDPDFLPAIGRFEANGQKHLVERLYQVYNANRKSLEEGDELKYPVVCIDTWTGVDQLCVNVGLAKIRQSTMPKARGDKGSIVYGTVKQKHQEVLRIARAVRALGAHLLVACHVVEREAEEALAGAPSTPVQMPALTGSFRDQFLAAFNLGLHANVNQDPSAKHRHYVQWLSDPKRLTKSRYPKPISKHDQLPNDWRELKPLLERARSESAEKAASNASPNSSSDGSSDRNASDPSHSSSEE